MARKPYVTVRAANVWNKGEIRIARSTLAITLVSPDGSEHQVNISLKEIVDLPLYKEIRSEGVVVRHVKFLFKLRPPLEVLFFRRMLVS